MNSLSWERGGQPSSYRSSNGKKDRASKCEQILAFGYSCKLFDDENSARFLDQGKNLVPSSGDNDLLIDRFDVRGYLNAVELEKYAAKFGFDYESQLTSDEVELERELDKERYRDLYAVADEPDHDEELRRLKEAIEEDDKKYNQIQFDYKQLEPRKVEESNSNLDDQESNEPFVVPEGLVLPDHLQLPTTMKEHNLIEKTARFINKQGAQMEILLKAKQSCNSQFDFLNYDSPLNPYYKHLVQLLKEGTYGGANQEDAGQQSDESTEDEGYLHPSLRGSSRPAQPTTHESSASSYHSYHSFAYPSSNPPPASNPTKTANSLYSKLAENLKDKIVVNDKSFYKPKIIESKGVRYDLSKSESQDSGQSTVRPEQTKEDSRSEKSAKQTKNSSNQTKSTQSVFDLTPEIPADIKLIIEKLAQYVCKNGDEFEKTIKARNESRFEFLNSGHKFHFHYVKTKLNLLEEKRKREAEAARKNGSSARPKPASSSSLPPEINSTNEYVGGKTVQPFVISAKKSTSFKEDLEAKLLRKKQEERKRKAAEFLNKLKQQKSDEKSPEKQVEEQPNIIGPQLPADLRREDLRNTPSPLREFYDDLDVRVDQQRKQQVFDEIKSIKEKLGEETSRSPEQTSFKRTAPKSKQYRVRERSSSGSERSAAGSTDRSRRSKSRSIYDAYRPIRTSRTTSRTPSRTPSRVRSRTPDRIRSRTRSRTGSRIRSESRSPPPHRRSRSKSIRRSHSRSNRRSRSKSNRRSRSKSKHRSSSKSKRSSRRHSRHSSSRSRSPKRRKSHRSKKRKRSKERRSRRSRDRRVRGKSEERSRERSRDRSSDGSSDRSRHRSKDRPRKRSKDRLRDKSRDRSRDRSRSRSPGRSPRRSQDRS